MLKNKKADYFEPCAWIFVFLMSVLTVVEHFTGIIAKIGNFFWCISIPIIIIAASLFILGLLKLKPETEDDLYGRKVF